MLEKFSRRSVSDDLTKDELGEIREKVEESKEKKKKRASGVFGYSE